MARSKSSHNWLREHFDDPYVKLAQQQKLRSRAAFKLIEIQNKDRMLKSGMTVVDLGSAPGGWSQITRDYLGKQGRLIALDILPMDPFPDVEFIHGDFSDDTIYQKLLDTLSDASVDFVLSDIAPNISGNRCIDQPRAMYLAELVLDFSCATVKPGGGMLIKVFQGEGFDEYLRTMRQHFSKVMSRKPNSSRARSRELFLLAQGKKE